MSYEYELDVKCPCGQKYKITFVASQPVPLEMLRISFDPEPEISKVRFKVGDKVTEMIIDEQC